jgi:hypothetical protein
VIVERCAGAETGAGFPQKREAVRDSFASFTLLTSRRMTEWASLLSYLWDTIRAADELCVTKDSCAVEDSVPVSLCAQLSDTIRLRLRCSPRAGWYCVPIDSWFALARRYHIYGEHPLLAHGQILE